MDSERSAEEWAATLVGFTVTQCTVDYAFALVLVRPLSPLSVAPEQQQYARLTIEAPFTLTLAGEVAQCVPETDPRGLGVALTLLWRTVESVQIGDNGTLRLSFSGGAHLMVASDPDYESWNMHTPEKALLVAIPGGDISVFAPVTDKRRHE